MTARAGVAAGGWSASAGFFDYDNDGKLDLFVTRYVDWSFKTNRYCGEQQARLPRLLPSRQLRRRHEHPVPQQRRRHVHRRVAEGGHRQPRGKGLGVAFADYDGDGFTDIYVANDSVQSFLFHNNRNGTFTEVGLLAGVGFNEDGKTFAGMGVDFADYDNDGRPDIFVTDLSNERYLLFRNNGDGSFRDVTNASGVGGATLPFSGWSTRFVDYRQRRLEGYLRRAGTRDGHYREDLAEPALPAAAAVAAQRRRAASSRVDAGRRRSEARGRAAARRSAISTTTATSTSSSATSARRPSCCATTAATRNSWLGIRTRRHEVEPRRDRLPRQSRVARPGLTQYLHRQRPRPAICPPATSD